MGGDDGGGYKVKVSRVEGSFDRFKLCKLCRCICYKKKRQTYKKTLAISSIHQKNMEDLSRLLQFKGNILFSFLLQLTLKWWSLNINFQSRTGTYHHSHRTHHCSHTEGTSAWTTQHQEKRCGAMTT